eukprot:904272-Amphidinium_carterae.1
MLLCKRGELLLKLRRPKAALQDSNAALKINPDSAKAYRLRGKVMRHHCNASSCSSQRELRDQLASNVSAIWRVQSLKTCVLDASDKLPWGL